MLQKNQFETYIFVTHKKHLFLKLLYDKYSSSRNKLFKFLVINSMKTAQL